MNQIINGKREGYWEINSHYNNIVKCYYKNDRLFGKYEHYNKNDILLCICSYDGNDNLIGLEEIFNMDGDRIYMTIYL
jgi:hypothetical protein